MCVCVCVCARARSAPLPFPSLHSVCMYQAVAVHIAIIEITSDSKLLIDTHPGFAVFC